MQILILETENTISGKIDDFFKKFVIVRSYKQKNDVLKHFRQPTCTKNTVLLKEALRIEAL